MLNNAHFVKPDAFNVSLSMSELCDFTRVRGVRLCIRPAARNVGRTASQLRKRTWSDGARVVVGWDTIRINRLPTRIGIAVDSTELLRYESRLLGGSVAEKVFGQKPLPPHNEVPEPRLERN